MAPIFDLNTLRLQIDELEHQGDRSRSARDALTHLTAALEALQVASEELQVQNEELGRALAELDLERERYRRLYGRLADGYLVVDAGGFVVEANGRAAELLGRPAATLVGEQIACALGEPASAEVRDLRRGRYPSVIADVGSRVLEIRVEPYPGTGECATAWLLRDQGGLEGEGEDLATDDPAVARGWLAVYSELIAISEAAAEAMERLEEPGTATGRPVESDRRTLESRLARLRRRQAMWRERHAELAGIQLDRASGLLRVGLREARLTRRETQLLSFLLQHPGVSFTAETLVNRAWLASFLSQEQLRTYVGRLRTALTEVGAPCQLVNRRGRGYALVFT